ncbi:MAG: hypothetical protein KAY29_02085 [Brevundimonas sp.]|nr:hypothetical protein [Brevundimonas sp.]
MIALLLALSLGQTPGGAVVSQPPLDPQETRMPCESTPEGWVCRMPPVILRPSSSGAVVMTGPAATSAPLPSTVPALAPPAEVSSAEADRQARLIARCADASWLSLCLPDDRREARALRDAANVRAALRSDVTRLLSEGKCDEAVRAALAGADMALAWEVRNMNFCAAGPASAEVAADPN